MKTPSIKDAVINLAIGGMVLISSILAIIKIDSVLAGATTTESITFLFVLMLAIVVAKDQLFSGLNMVKDRNANRKVDLGIPPT